MAQSSDAVETTTSETATSESEPETKKLGTEAETKELETENETKSDTNELENENKTKAEAKELETEAEAKELETENDKKSDTKELENETKKKSEAKEFGTEAEAKEIETENETKSDTKEPENENKTKSEAKELQNENENEKESDTAEPDTKNETDTQTKTGTSVSENKDQPSSADGNDASLNSSFNRDIENLISEVQELHDLDEEAWSLRKYHYSPKGTTCRGAYNNERKMIRIKGAVEAPLERVLSYILEPPYGYRKESQSSYRVIEKIGSGAALIYKEKPEQVVCCFRIAPRDGVYLAVLRILTSETAVFAMKTVEHSSYPPSEDGYRVNVPLIALYVQQEGDLTTVESYFAETDLGGKLGKAGPGKSIEQNVDHMILLAQSIPKIKDGVPPYTQLL